MSQDQVVNRGSGVLGTAHWWRIAHGAEHAKSDAIGFLASEVEFGLTLCVEVDASRIRTYVSAILEQNYILNKALATIDRATMRAFYRKLETS